MSQFSFPLPNPNIEDEIIFESILHPSLNNGFVNRYTYINEYPLKGVVFDLGNSYNQNDREPIGSFQYSDVLYPSYITSLQYAFTTNIKHIKTIPTIQAQTTSWLVSLNSVQILNGTIDFSSFSPNPFFNKSQQPVEAQNLTNLTVSINPKGNTLNGSFFVPGSGTGAGLSTPIEKMFDVTPGNYSTINNFQFHATMKGYETPSQNGSIYNSFDGIVKQSTVYGYDYLAPSNSSSSSLSSNIVASALTGNFVINMFTSPVSKLDTGSNVGNSCSAFPLAVYESCGVCSDGQTPIKDLIFPYSGPAVMNNPVWNWNAFSNTPQECCYSFIGYTSSSSSAFSGNYPGKGYQSCSDCTGDYNKFPLQRNPGCGKCASTPKTGSVGAFYASDFCCYTEGDTLDLTIEVLPSDPTDPNQTITCQCEQNAPPNSTFCGFSTGSYIYKGVPLTNVITFTNIFGSEDYPCNNAIFPRTPRALLTFDLMRSGEKQFGFEFDFGLDSTNWPEPYTWHPPINPPPGLCQDQSSVGGSGTLVANSCTSFSGIIYACWPFETTDDGSPVYVKLRVTVSVNSSGACKACPWGCTEAYQPCAYDCGSIPDTLYCLAPVNIQRDANFYPLTRGGCSWSYTPTTSAQLELPVSSIVFSYDNNQGWIIDIKYTNGISDHGNIPTFYPPVKNPDLSGNVQDFYGLTYYNASIYFYPAQLSATTCISPETSSSSCELYKFEQGEPFVNNCPASFDNLYNNEKLNILIYISLGFEIQLLIFKGSILVKNLISNNGSTIECGIQVDNELIPEFSANSFLTYGDQLVNSQALNNCSPIENQIIPPQYPVPFIIGEYPKLNNIYKIGGGGSITIYPSTPEFRNLLSIPSIYPFDLTQNLTPAPLDQKSNILKNAASETINLYQAAFNIASQYNSDFNGLFSTGDFSFILYNQIYSETIEEKTTYTQMLNQFYEQLKLNPTNGFSGWNGSLPWIYANGSSSSLGIGTPAFSSIKNVVGRNTFTFDYFDEEILLNYQLAINSDTNTIDFGDLVPVRVYNISQTPIIITESQEIAIRQNRDWTSFTKDTGIYQSISRRDEFLEWGADSLSGADITEIRTRDRFLYYDYQTNIFNSQAVNFNIVQPISVSGNNPERYSIKQGGFESAFIGKNNLTSSIILLTEMVKKDSHIYVSGIFAKKIHFRQIVQTHVGVDNTRINGSTNINTSKTIVENYNFSFKKQYLKSTNGNYYYVNLWRLSELGNINYQRCFVQSPIDTGPRAPVNIITKTGELVRKLLRYFYTADSEGIKVMALYALNTDGTINPVPSLGGNITFFEETLILASKDIRDQNWYNFYLKPILPIKSMNATPNMLFDMSDLTNNTYKDWEKLPYTRNFAQALAQVSKYDPCDKTTGVGVCLLDFWNNGNILPLESCSSSSSSSSSIQVNVYNDLSYVVFEPRNITESNFPNYTTNSSPMAIAKQVSIKRYPQCDIDKQFSINYYPLTYLKKGIGIPPTINLGDTFDITDFTNNYVAYINNPSQTFPFTYLGEQNTLSIFSDSTVGSGIIPNSIFGIGAIPGFYQITYKYGTFNTATNTFPVECQDAGINPDVDSRKFANLSYNTIFGGFNTVPLTDSSITIYHGGGPISLFGDNTIYSNSSSSTFGPSYSCPNNFPVVPPQLWTDQYCWEYYSGYDFTGAPFAPGRESFLCNFWENTSQTELEGSGGCCPSWQIKAVKATPLLMPIYADNEVTSVKVLNQLQGINGADFGTDTRIYVETFGISRQEASNAVFGSYNPSLPNQNLGFYTLNPIEYMTTQNSYKALGSISIAKDPLGRFSLITSPQSQGNLVVFDLAGSQPYPSGTLTGVNGTLAPLISNPNANLSEVNNFCPNFENSGYITVTKSK